MRRPIIAMTLAVGALALAPVLAACTPGGSMSDPTPSASATSRPRFQTAPPGPIAPTGPLVGTPVAVPPARWDALVADLGARGVTATPELVSAEAVTFSDSSLGCATPGQSYTQALVDGMRVVVTAGGETYDYRFGTGDDPLLCMR